MEQLLFYDKNFQFVGLIKGYIGLTWTRRFSNISEFNLKLAFINNNVSLALNSYFIQKGNEVMKIENVKDAKNIKGSSLFEVSGRDFVCILDWRIINYTGRAKLSEVLKNIINQNFISPVNVNRKINNFRLTNFSLLNDPIIDVKYENMNGLELVTQLCLKYQIGLKVYVQFGIKEYWLDFYEGNETKVLFSENFKNILEQEYFYRSQSYKNVCLIGGLTVNDSISGIDRREMAGNINTEETTTIQEQGAMLLAKNGIIQTVDTVINSKNLQFEYRKEWDLGSKVSNESKRWGLLIKKQITEIVEYYEGDDVKIAPVFGDLI